MKTHLAAWVGGSYCLAVGLMLTIFQMNWTVNWHVVLPGIALSTALFGSLPFLNDARRHNKLRPKIASTSVWHDRRGLILKTLDSQNLFGPVATIVCQYAKPHNFPDSCVLNSDQLEQLASFHPRPAAWRLANQWDFSNVYGFSNWSSSTYWFGSRNDDNSRMVVMRTTGGLILGGYTSVGWAPRQVKGVSSVDSRPDTEAYLFKVENGVPVVRRFRPDYPCVFTQRVCGHVDDFAAVAATTLPEFGNSIMMQCDGGDFMLMSPSRVMMRYEFELPQRSINMYDDSHHRERIDVIEVFEPLPQMAR